MSDVLQTAVPQDIARHFSKIPSKKTKSQGITALIPIRGAGRQPNLEIVLPYILAQNIEPVEILIIEEDAAPVIKLDKFSKIQDLQRIFLASNKPFNKSRAMNLGTARAKYNKVCMIDVDMIIDQTLLSKISTTLDTYDVCFPIREIYFLTQLPLFTNFFHNGQSWTSKCHWFCHGGIVAYNRIPYSHIGGMNENFIGHGSEDTEFYKRALQLLKCQDTRFATVLHSPHPTDTSLAKNNLQKYRELEKIPKENTAKELRAYFEAAYGILNEKQSLQSCLPNKDRSVKVAPLTVAGLNCKNKVDRKIT